ncbi:ester cyclase [Christiangramia sabulilitoris]|uniref:Ester cyclase n=1 Tax=Christiangramia sabulilitoris TaxID=2583991 RepID=A0A550I067_9FLAO|nr:ester cyclase [Christiangramia sabulilitoris]TRO64379.1 ester cyclase [Christiangramia sabulilitoris]
MKILKLLFITLFLAFSSCESNAKKERKLEEVEKEMAHTRIERMEKDIGATLNDIQEAWNTNNKTLFRKVTNEDLTRFTNGKKEISTRAEYLNMMNSFHEGFSNVNVEITGETQFADHKSYSSFIFSGDNTGDFMGNPPTQRSVSIIGFSIWSYNEDGIAIQEEVYYDNHELLNQLGYVTSFPE